MKRLATMWFRFKSFILGRRYFVSIDLAYGKDKSFICKGFIDKNGITITECKEKQ